MRRPITSAGAAGVLTALLVPLVGCTGTGGSGADADDRTTTGGSPSSAASADVPERESRRDAPDSEPAREPEDLREAGAATRRFLAEVSATLADPDTAADADPGGVTGVAREALLAQAAEYADNGWHVTGSPRVVDLEVRRLGRDGLRVRACLDQSRVRVLDSDGTELPRGSASPRTLTIYLLAADGEGWQVTDQTFPQRPDCS